MHVSNYLSLHLSVFQHFLLTWIYLENLEAELTDNMPFILICIQVKRALFATLIANNMHDNAHVRLTLTRGEKVWMQYFSAKCVLMEMYSFFNISIISIVDSKN